MKTAAFLMILPLCLSPFSLGADDERHAENPKDPSVFSLERRLIFYAVLEGLYEDGVAGEALDLIIPDERGMWTRDEPDKTNFVYTCPICMSAFEALRLYKVRSPFYGQKSTRYTTFGPGLPYEVLNRLKASPRERRDAIQELIRTWVSRRLDMMSLRPNERARIENNIAEMKKEGEAALKRFQDRGHGDAFAVQYADWEKCAACEGAAGAVPVSGNEP